MSGVFLASRSRLSKSPQVLHRLHPGPRSVDRRSHLQTIAGMWLHLGGAEPLDEADFEMLRELYEAEVAMTDALLGELTANLREQGVLDETLVVVTADHGENIGDHGLIDHLLSFYDSTTRIPLLLRYPPRVLPGQAPDELVSLIDVAATILDVCGLPPPTGFRAAGGACSTRTGCSALTSSPRTNGR